jgi:predicted  nucleic acid-binding Zn-ribbon protein
VKSIETTKDAIGITLGAIGSIGLIIAIGWSSMRALKIENTMQEVMIETAKTTSLVFIILLGAAMLTAAFRAFGGEELVRDFLNSMPGGFWSKFIIVMAVIFVLGFFLDFIEIAVVVVPIVAPILLADPSANITAVWLGVMIGLNIQTSFLTPPFGFALFYLRGVAPAIVKTVDMYKGVIAFITLQLLALVIVGFYPQLVNYLPNRSSLTSETAPPPRNPRLNYCVDRYIADQFVTNGAAINAAIAEARQLNLDYLPPRLKTGIEKSFDAAETAPGLMADAWKADERINEEVGAYKPVQTEVRFIESEIADLDEEIRDLKTDISRMRSDDLADAKKKLEDRVAALEEERKALVAEIPADWKETYAAFKKLLKDESLLRSKFNRAAGEAYKPIAETIAILKSNDAYMALQPELTQIQSDLAANADPEALLAAVEELSSRVGEIDGASDVSSGLSKVRRNLRERTRDIEKAAAEMVEVMADYEAQIDWRTQAGTNLLPTLEKYEQTIRSTMGLREQRKLNKEQAVYVAGCQSGHRDVSHYF